MIAEKQAFVEYEILLSSMNMRNGQLRAEHAAGCCCCPFCIKFRHPWQNTEVVLA